LPFRLLAATFNIVMKTLTIISRILPGFIYLVFGLDYYLHFIPYQPNHTGAAAAFKDGLMAAGYFYPMMKSIQIVGGISLLINRYAPFFAVVLFPISINVFLFHTILVPSGWYMGVLLIVPNLFLGYAYRKYYSGMFVKKAEA
jgi:putative oxidoreductase